MSSASAPIAGPPADLFKSFAFYAALVLGKTLLMAGLTAFRRIRSKIFVNPEDAAAYRTSIVVNNESVERIRRNHLNDLENVLPFVLIGWLYLYTEPQYTTALWQFRAFAISRILHTVTYQLAVPQPARALSFGVGLVVTMSMLMRCLRTFLPYH